jgi:c-di-GMP-binding flagellar brake protein YcgR
MPDHPQSATIAQEQSALALQGHSVLLSCDAAGRRRVFHSTLGAPVSLHGDLQVAWPRLADGEPVALRPGQPVLVELASPFDALYLADARVTEQQPGRPELLALRADGPWKRVQHRHDVRWPVTIVPRVVETVGSGATVRLAARIENVSAGGVLLRLDEQLAPKQLLTIEFALPGDPRALLSEVVVERVNRSEDGAYAWEAGCRFRHPRERDADRIVRFIFAEQSRVARALRRAATGSVRQLGRRTDAPRRM